MTLTHATLTGTWESLGTYERYEQAQAAVDKLADKGFAVEKLAIVGRDLRSIERVIGRLTAWRSVLVGITSGAWWGLFVGIVLSMFTPEFLAPVVAAALLGAAFGAVLGFLYWITIGKARSFTSVQALGATSYELLATGGIADDARLAM